MTEALVAGAAIIVTVGIFLLIVWCQSLKVEIPLSYERIRGYSMKWPLSFFYTSNIPVILAAALLANIQLFGSLLENVGYPLLGTFSQGQAISGISYWLGHSNLVENAIRGSLTGAMILQGFTHLIFYVVVSAVFAVFWVKTSGMDESSQAKNILSSGLQIPGFRKDQRVLESILKRYILPLTVMGGITDSLGALTSGTAILLAITITYQLYQNIAQQHAVDMHPSLRKLMK
jgi:preprotein translocase subunit SecY